MTRPKVRSSAWAWVGVTGWVIAAGPAHALNGLNLIAVGFEANAMGGADAGLADGPFALNANPAGLASLSGLRLDSQGLLVQAIDVSHGDAFNTSRDISNQQIYGTNLAMSYRAPDWPATFGASMVTQGGAGAVYQRLNTAFGTRDELSAIIRIAKLSVGGAIALDERLSIGVAATLYYADANQKVFAGTSAIDRASGTAFFGSELHGANGVSPGARLGAQYRVTDALALGLAYATESDLRLTGSELYLNETAIGLGRVRYHDVAVTGLNQPNQIDVGPAWQVSDRLKLSAKASWLNWSSALRQTTLSASRPDNAAATPRVSQTLAQNWHDQAVFALGAAFAVEGATTLYAGVNYGTNPVPSAHTSPLLNGTGQTHLTGGVSWLWRDDVKLGVGFEYQLPSTVAYDNRQLAFLPNSRDGYEYLALFVGVSFIW